MLLCFPQSSAKVLHYRDTVQSNYINIYHLTTHRYVEDNGSAAMLATNRSAGVTPKVNLREL